MLRPHKRYTPSDAITYEAIYATPLPAFAAAHSFPWSTKEGVHLEVSNGQVIFILPKEFKERLQVPISIYKIPINTFLQTQEEKTGYTWHTTSAVEIIEETKYSNVEEALILLGAELTYI